MSRTALALSALLLVRAGDRAQDVAEPATPVGAVTGMAIGDGRLFSCSQAGVLAHALKTAAVKRVLCRPKFRVIDLVALPPSERLPHGGLLVAGGRPGKSGVVALQSFAGATILTRTVAKDVVYAVAVTADGKLGAAALADGGVVTFDIASLEKVRRLHEHTAAARDVAFAAADKKVVSVGLDHVVMISDMTAKAKKPLALQSHTGALDCVAVTSDGKRIASGARDGKVRLHNADGRFLRTYQGLGEEVWSLCFGTGGELFAGLANGAVRRLLDDSDQSEVVRAAAATAVSSILRTGTGLVLGVRGGVETVALR